MKPTNEMSDVRCTMFDLPIRRWIGVANQESLIDAEGIPQSE
jgi:hypothetical protein